MQLRRPHAADLDLFFEHQRDQEACHMAAFTRPDPDDREAFDRHWQRILQDPQVDIYTIEAAGEVVGHVLSYVQDGDREVRCWLAREHWRKGLATLALQAYLDLQPTRPLHARVAADNPGSRRVLEKTGFQQVGEDHGFAEARQQEVRELLFRLD